MFPINANTILPHKLYKQMHRQNYTQFTDTVHSSPCVLNFTSPTCRPNFAEAVLTTLIFQHACVSVFKTLLDHHRETKGRISIRGLDTLSKIFHCFLSLYENVSITEITPRALIFTCYNSYSLHLEIQTQITVRPQL
jgi:hypothetical protein